MARPAGDADKKLLEAGRALLAEGGFGGLSVRAVAARAGVNLSLVSYHFGGKQAFVRRVAQEAYEEFFRDFSLEVGGQASAPAALRAGLLKLAAFLRDHRRLIAGLLKDAANGDAEARRFLAENMSRHARVIAQLLRRGKAAGQLADLPLPVMLATLLGCVAAPTLLAEPLGQAMPGLLRALRPRAVEQALLSERALVQRVDLALKALKP